VAARKRAGGGGGDVKNATLAGSPPASSEFSGTPTPHYHSKLPVSRHDPNWPSLSWRDQKCRERWYKSPALAINLVLYRRRRGEPIGWRPRRGGALVDCASSQLGSLP